MKIALALCLSLLILSLAFAQNFKSKEGYFPNSEIAVKIAEAVLIPVDRQEQIEEGPFTAKLKDNAWTIRGTLRCPDTGKPCIGGVAVVESSKLDARIISMVHYK